MASVATIIDALTAKFSNDEGNIVIPQDELVKALGSMKSSTRGRARKAKKEKDPDSPKRPTSAYMLWLNENRSSIREEYFPANCDGEHCYPQDYPESYLKEEILSELEENKLEELQNKRDKPLTGRDKVTLIAKKAGEIWKELDEESKAPYVSKFEEASSAYKEAMGVYTPSESKVKYDATEIPEAPEGWSGPFKMTYLPKVSKDPETEKNFRSFKSFEEAVSAANELEEGCAGITKTSTGYSLRIGPELRQNPEKDSNSGIASWVKGTEEPEVVPPSPKSSPKLKKKKIKTPEPEDVEPEAEKPKGKAPRKQLSTKEKKEEKPKKLKKVVVKAPTPPPPEPESDDDEPELEVEEITIDDKNYYLDSNSGDIYDMESQEVVGKSENGKHTIF